MKAPGIACMVLLLFCGCSTPPAGAPSDLGDGFRREHHPAFTPQEQVILTATRRHLEQSYGRRVDAYYRVSHASDGYSVLVLEVYRYVEKQPQFRVGGDWLVSLGEDGTVAQVIRGK